MKFNAKLRFIPVFLILIALSAFFMLSCERTTQMKKQSVAAVFPVTVDAFMDFQNEAGKVLSKNNIEFNVFSAEGDPSRFQTVINAALMKNPDVLILVGTQLTNTGLSARYEKEIPHVISSCVSEPDKVEQLTAIGIDPTRKRPVAIITDMPKQDAYSYGADLIRKVTPGILKAGILYNLSEINSVNTATKMAEALEFQHINVLKGIVSSEEDVDKVARKLVLQGAQLLVIPHDKYVIKKAATVIKIAMEAETPIPVFSLDGGTVRTEGAAYGVSVDYGRLGQLTAEMSLDILKGLAPESMPIVQQQTANAYFNLDTWNKLKLPAIPEAISKTAVTYKRNAQH